MTMINAGYGSRWMAEVPYTGKVEITDPQNGRYSKPPLKAAIVFPFLNTPVCSLTCAIRS